MPPRRSIILMIDSHYLLIVYWLSAEDVAPVCLNILNLEYFLLNNFELLLTLNSKASVITNIKNLKTSATC